MYRIAYADGRKTDCSDLECAYGVLSYNFPDAEIGHDGDLDDGGTKTLVWENDDYAMGDDGAQAVATITHI